SFWRTSRTNSHRGKTDEEPTNESTGLLGRGRGRRHEREGTGTSAGTTSGAGTRGWTRWPWRRTRTWRSGQRIRREISADRDHDPESQQHHQAAVAGSDAAAHARYLRPAAILRRRVRRPERPVPEQPRRAEQ